MAAETGLEMIEERESEHIKTEEEIILKYYTKPQYSEINGYGFELPF